jgi:hypothetical protein
MPHSHLFGGDRVLAAQQVSHVPFLVIVYVLLIITYKLKIHQHGLSTYLKAIWEEIFLYNAILLVGDNP